MKPVTAGVGLEFRNSLPCLPSGVYARPSPQPAVDATQLMASAFLDAADPLVLESVSGEILRANAAFEQLVGVRAEVLGGQSVVSFLPPAERWRAQKQRLRCLSGEDQRGLEVGVSDAEGGLHLMLVTVSLLTDVEGEAMAVSYHFMDLGRVKEQLNQSKEEIEKLEATLKLTDARLAGARERTARAATKAQRLESLLAAQLSISNALKASVSVDDALTDLLRIACGVGGFELGEFWPTAASENVLATMRGATFRRPFVDTQPAVAAQRVLVVVVRSRLGVCGVLRFIGASRRVEQSLLRMLEQVGLHLGEFLAAEGNARVVGRALGLK